MRILLIADVHANWPALAAIDEEFDVCLFAGDLVDYGCDPVPCIEWARKHITVGVRGNHDHAVAQRISPRGGSGYRQLAAVSRPLHWEMISPRMVKYLGRLPVSRLVEYDGIRFHLLHATPRDPLDEYLGPDAAAWESRLAGVEADIVCVGHTHTPFELEVGSMRVLNPGSVGQPRDGDPRASYVIIEDGRIEFKRCEYDISATLEKIRQCDVPDWFVEATERVLRTGGRVSKSEIDEVCTESGEPATPS